MRTWVASETWRHVYRSFREPPVEVRVTKCGDVAPRLEEDVRRQIGRLDRLVNAPVLDAHVVLTQEENPRIERPARAEAEIDVNGHVIRGRAAEAEMRHAIDQLAEQVGHQLRRFVERQATVRRRPRRPPAGEWRHGQWSAPRPAYFPRPVGERVLVRRRSFTPDAMSATEAAVLMEDLDHHFLLFHDSRTDIDAVVYVRDDGRLGVIVPAGTSFPQDLGEGDAYESSRLTEPLTIEAATAEMDELNHRFLYFVNADTGRTNLIYMRYDGHYGLIEPATPNPPGAHMRHERTAKHRTHRLVIHIEQADGLFEASIEEPDGGKPHWTMSGPPLPYDEVVDEVIEALGRHLRSPGE